MQIIGHRGAAGLALENTLDSLEIACLLGVGIELDVRKTQDGELVVCHDANLQRIANRNRLVSHLTLKKLQRFRLIDGHSIIPSLREALQIITDTPVIIELKESGCEKPLLKVLKDFPQAKVSVASFKLDELARLRKLKPELKLYGLERTRPTEIIHLARSAQLSGIGLNFWLLNPLTYWLVRRRKLEIYAFTVNNRLLGRFLGWLYPEVAICTDHPERFLKLPTLKSYTKE